MNRAFFVKYPTTYKELLTLPADDCLLPFEIVCTVTLSRLEYQNFIYGMDVDRQFIDGNAHLCSDGTVKKCLLVRQKWRRRGILVVPRPNDPSYVLWAAYLKHL